MIMDGSELELGGVDGVGLPAFQEAQEFFEEPPGSHPSFQTYCDAFSSVTS